jgi:hypothetical protein
MEILEAFDLTGSFRAAGDLAGCSHHTVAHWVALRDQGLLPARLEPVERTKLIDPFMPRSRNGSSVRKARSGPTRRSNTCRRWGSRGRTARSAERLPG